MGKRNRERPINIQGRETERERHNHMGQRNRGGPINIWEMEIVGDL